MEAGQVAELKVSFLWSRLPKHHSGVLWDVRLADRDAVRFAKGLRSRAGMKLENCPAYVREWMDREKD